MDIKKFNQEFLNVKISTEQGNWSHLTEASKYAKVSGDIIEVGVFEGNTITHLSSLFPNNNLYGFDSFEGLPEEWAVSEFETISAGRFSLNGNLPSVPDNVVLIKGWFSDTFPSYENKIKSLKFLHIDCDLYSSSKLTLETFNNQIKKGTVIVFDEFCKFDQNQGWYDNWKEGEYKSCIEWMQKYDRELRPICRGIQEQCCFIVEK